MILDTYVPSPNNRPPTGSDSSSSTYPNAGPSQANRPGTGGPSDARYPTYNGPENSVATYPRTPDAGTTDVYNAVRNAFKLPPGLCLVRCDTLRSDQQSLTPQQAHDAFTSSGIIGPSSGGTGVPSGSLDTSQQGGRLPQSQLAQYPVGSQTHVLPSGGQLGTLQPGGAGQTSNVGDQYISSRPAGGIGSRIDQQGGDDGGYRYQTPQDRLPSNVGGPSTGKIASEFF